MIQTVMEGKSPYLTQDLKEKGHLIDFSPLSNVRSMFEAIADALVQDDRLDLIELRKRIEALEAKTKDLP